MSFSYGIVLHEFKIYILVNTEFGDPVDVLLELNNSMQTCKMQKYYEGIETVLYDDEPPYKTIRLIFTTNNGLVVTARYVFINESGESVNLANLEVDAERSMQMAEFVLWCDCIRNDLPNAIKEAVNTSKLSKEKACDEEICVICHKEYKAEDMIGTLRCEHSYHDECIKKWLTKTRELNCPICRDRAFFWEKSNPWPRIRS